MAKRGPRRAEPEMLLTFGRKQIAVGSRERILALLEAQAATGSIGSAKVYRMEPLSITTRIVIDGADSPVGRRKPGRPKGSKIKKRGPGRPKGSRNKKPRGRQG